MEDIFDGLLDKKSPEKPENTQKIDSKKDALRQTSPRKTQPSRASNTNNLQAQLQKT